MRRLLAGPVFAVVAFVFTPVAVAEPPDGKAESKAEKAARAGGAGDTGFTPTEDEDDTGRDLPS